jgi:hypothetical protein
LTPPTPDQQDAALAALTGTVTESRPDTELARNLMRLRLVAEAKAKGIPWTAIGKALGGISGKEAKRVMKHLAARTQRDHLVAELATGKGSRAVESAPEGPSRSPVTCATAGPSPRSPSRASENP